MAVRMMRLHFSVLGELRLQPTDKRVRALLGGEVVVDTCRAMLVWEPMRVVPSYAVPVDDLVSSLVPADDVPAAAAQPVTLDAATPRVLDPSSPFSAHTAPGQSLTVELGDARAVAAAYRFSDPDAADLVELDFDAFDWLEEDEPIVGHPHDPFSRIDVLRSSRRVRFERDGVLLAESQQPSLLFETALPVPRYYLPREDVRVDLLRSETRTTCAYKGHATHWSVRIGDRVLPDLAWSYEDPLHDAEQVRGMVAFYQERVDTTVDGEALDRPRTPWS